MPLKFHAATPARPIPPPDSNSVTRRPAAASRCASVMPSTPPPRIAKDCGAWSDYLSLLNSFRIWAWASRTDQVATFHGRQPVRSVNCNGPIISSRGMTGYKQIATPAMRQFGHFDLDPSPNTATRTHHRSVFPLGVKSSFSNRINSPGPHLQTHPTLRAGFPSTM